MTKTYAQLMKQIDTLTREADKLKRKEVEGVVARIKEAIAIYGLTAADLGLERRRGRPAASAGTAKRGRKSGKGGKAKLSAAAKYRDEAGNTWVGRGPRPRWLREALSAGKRLEDFAV
ncbi:MAG TPA: H-NS histone family protein [Albitalea sp.]|nr:H-NS histone family protein [Albitalea sp.]